MLREFSQLFLGQQWLMPLADMRVLVQRASSATPEAIQAAIVAYGQRDPGPKMVGDVAVIEACGVVTYKPSWWSMYFGGMSIMEMQQQLQTALADPAVKTIVFHWDSPGGVVDMVPEFADLVFQARGQKPILSIADTMICSAAYWIAAQTDAIHASTSARIGSIGVYLEHDDISAMLEKAGIKVTLIAHGDHKVDGNSYEPLSDAVKADLKADVDEVGVEFEAAVARGRGVTSKVVVATFGQGKVFRGKKAIALGLADKGGTYAQVMGKLTKGRAQASVLAAAVRAAIVIVPTVALVSDVTGLTEVMTPLAAASTHCDTCTPECPCDHEGDCPDDCPDCDPGCPCREDNDEGKAAKALAAADADALLITTLLGR